MACSNREQTTSSLNVRLVEFRSEDGGNKLAVLEIATVAAGVLDAALTAQVDVGQDNHNLQ